MIPRGMVLRPEYVKANNVNCELCEKEAYATHFDKEWDSRDYCEEHYPKEITPTE